MKNKMLNDFLDNLRVESGLKEETVSDLENYLDRNDLSSEDEDLSTFLQTKQSGKVYRDDLKYTRGKTGSNIYYNIDLPALKEVLEKVVKKNFTLTQVESIVSAVRLALGVGTEEEKSSFRK